MTSCDFVASAEVPTSGVGAPEQGDEHRVIVGGEVCGGDGARKDCGVCGFNVVALNHELRCRVSSNFPTYFGVISWLCDAAYASAMKTYIVQEFRVCDDDKFQRITNSSALAEIFDLHGGEDRFAPYLGVSTNNSSALKKAKLVKIAYCLNPVVRRMLVNIWFPGLGGTTHIDKNVLITLAHVLRQQPEYKYSPGWFGWCAMSLFDSREQAFVHASRVLAFPSASKLRQVLDRQWAVGCFDIVHVGDIIWHVVPARMRAREEFYDRLNKLDDSDIIGADIEDSSDSDSDLFTDEFDLGVAFAALDLNLVPAEFKDGMAASERKIVELQSFGWRVWSKNIAFHAVFVQDEESPRDCDVEYVGEIYQEVIAAISLLYLHKNANTRYATTSVGICMRK